MIRDIRASISSAFVPVLAVLFGCCCRDVQSTEPAATDPPARLTTQQEKFKDYKLGMFIHFGFYSPGSPKHDVGEFNPTEFDARNWVATAKSAGARYITFTSKHHEGFCLFDSKLTDYTSVKSPVKKDFVGELAAECHREKMPLFIYYSPLDWHHPDFTGNWPAYLNYWHGQLRELAANYGEVAGFWLDVGPSERPLKYQMCEAAKLLHQFQPKCLVMGFDFYETEQNLNGVGHFNEQGQTADLPMPTPSPEAYPWEICNTINKSWFYDPNDENHKSSRELIRLLVEVVGRGGNMVLNSGPMPSGRFQAEHIERLRAIGAWLQENGDSIYETRPLGSPVPDWGFAVSRGRHVYLHVLKWPEGKLSVQGLRNKVLSASLYQGAKLEFEQHDDSVQLQLPDSARDPIDTIVVLATAE